MPVKQVQTKRLYQQISEQLFDLVVAGEFAPGSCLPPEKELARQLGVSRPSVREALIVLETAKIIEVVNGAGSFVRSDLGHLGAGRRLPWTQEALGPGPLEQFLARFIVEPELAAEAARQASTDEVDALEAIVTRIAEQLKTTARVNSDHFLFHEQVAAASRNQVLAQVVSDLVRRTQHEDTWRTVRQRLDTAENLQKGLAFRRRLIERLRTRDIQAARRLMRRHLSRIGALYFGEDFQQSANVAVSETGKIRTK